MSTEKKDLSNLVKRFYTVAEFHELISQAVSKVQIYRMIRRGEIPVKYFGQKALIPGAWVDNFLDDSTYRTKPGA